MAQPFLDEATHVEFIFCIATEKPGAPANYCSERMRQYLAQHGETEVDPSSERFARMVAPVSAVPLADREVHPKFSTAADQLLRTQLAGALRMVNQKTPLFDGEVVEQDEFTFLTAPFNGCSERTAVLRRTTNFGELLYLFADVTVDSTGGLLFQAAPQRLPAKVEALAFAIDPKSVAANVAKEIATGMLSAVGGAIAGAILDSVFPPGVPSYFDKVYAQMEKIVGAQLQQATIDQVNGAINNIKTHLATEYQPAKQGKNLDDAEERQHLFALLQKYETTYLSGPGGMLGTLMSPKYEKVGFSVFLLGASLHLALYQEMANVDPRNKGPDGRFRSPLDSSYGRPQSGTIASTAKQYADFAKRVWNNIIDARKAKIWRRAGYVSVPGAAWGGHYAWFRDDLRPGNLRLPGGGTVNGFQPGDAAGLDQEYNAYVAEQLKALSTSLDDPAGIMAAWEQLVATPILASNPTQS